jgi:RNA polymerase sigma-70 factor (ECF subfamily)
MGNEPLTIQRALDGDVTAMRELYEAHAGRVYAILRRLAGDDDLAQDLAQDVWVTTFRKLDGFEGRSAFGTWLYRVAVNTALGRLRSRAREPVVELARDDWADPASDRADPAVDRVALARALDQLPDGYRMVLVLHDMEGYTHEEIADQLKIAPGTSKSQLHKARARMRQLLTAGVRKVNDVASH